MPPTPATLPPNLSFFPPPFHHLIQAQALDFSLLDRLTPPPRPYFSTPPPPPLSSTPSSLVEWSLSSDPKLQEIQSYQPAPPLWNQLALPNLAINSARENSRARGRTRNSCGKDFSNIIRRIRDTSQRGRPNIRAISIKEQESRFFLVAEEDKEKRPAKKGQGREMGRGMNA